MKQNRFGILVLAGFLLPAVHLGTGTGGGGKTGIVKGSVTLDGRPARDVVVSIEGLPATTLKPGRVMMDQREKKFIPRVLPVTVGTAVEFPNNDGTWHNVFSSSEATKFDLGLYPPGKSRSVTFDNPGVVRILCNVHPNMEAFIAVKEHPHFASPDARGNYRFDAVPLGKYRLEVWYPESGTKVEPFNLVREGEVLSIDVNIRSLR